jgi:hypothetical protein
MHAPNRSRDDTLSGRGYQGPPLAHDPYAAAASRTAVPIQNSPPLSQVSTDNSLSSRARSQRSPSTANSHLSSSSSVSGGPGLYSPAGSEFRRQSVKSNNQEAALAHHYSVLKVYLAPYLRDEQGNTRPTRARDKCASFSPAQKHFPSQEKPSTPEAVHSSTRAIPSTCDRCLFRTRKPNA